MLPFIPARRIDFVHSPVVLRTLSSVPGEAGSNAARGVEDLPIGITTRKLLVFARPEVRPLSAAVLFLGVSTGASLLWPAMMGQIMDIATQAPSESMLSSPAGLAAAMFGISTVSSLSRAAQTVLLTVAGERISKRLRQRLFAAILRQKTDFFDEHRTGELVNRLAADATMAQKALSTNAASGLSAIFNLAGSCGMLLWISPKLTLVSMLAMPIAGVGSVYLGRYMKERQEDVQNALAKTTTKAEEVISNVRTVRQFSMERAEATAYAHEAEGVFSLAREMSVVIAGYQGMISFTFNASMATVIGFGGAQVTSGAISPGDMTAFLMYSLYLAGSAHSLSGVYTEFMKAVGACNRIFQIMDSEDLRDVKHEPLWHWSSPVPKVEHFSDVEAFLGNEAGAVPPHALQGLRAFTLEFDNVHFAYPSRPDQKVLAGFNLAVQPGEHVALVGASGSGKSTVASLITRLYDPCSGAVRIGGINSSEINAEWLRRQVGVVAQEPVLFNASILENIRYGSPSATDEDVKRAAQEANAHDFIVGFPDGYATEVGERGAQLSGGQKQRVAIARAILKDPPMLILDEATSALDAASEHYVQQAIERVSWNRTVISIAHRISTIRAADRVVVLDAGVVAETGSFEELTSAMSGETRLRALLHRQLMGAPLEAILPS